MRVDINAAGTTSADAYRTAVNDRERFAQLRLVGSISNVSAGRRESNLKHGIVGSLRCSSTRSGSRRLSSNQGALDDVGGAVFQIGKLSNKLSTHNWAHSANHHLARQVHQRHVLTL